MLSQNIEQNESWSERSEHWRIETEKVLKPRARRERRKEPLILCGHGVSLRIESGTLKIRDGRTHHPQDPATHRFFKGDLALPTRIILLDGSGAVTFNVLDWLVEEGVTLVRLTWKGEVRSVLSGHGYAADREKIRWQIETRNDASRRVAFSTDLIRQKITGCIETIAQVIPASSARNKSLDRMGRDLDILQANPPFDVTSLRGVEARAGAAYFAAWAGVPIGWKVTARRPIPDAWRQLGPRSASRAGKITKNEKASHPINAMLNYAYGIKQSQLRILAVAAGYDPTLGIMHHSYQGSAAYIFDLMEPERPKVDLAVLTLVLGETFTGSDFMILSDGVCRLSPQLARRLAQLSSG